jgi:hypothetical protein
VDGGPNRRLSSGRQIPTFGRGAAVSRLQSPDVFGFFGPASLTKRQTVARGTRCFFATSVKLIPERRSATTCCLSIFRGARPIRRPSNFALRIPALTRSTIKLLSSSAIAPTITIFVRPSGPELSTPRRPVYFNSFFLDNR